MELTKPTAAMTFVLVLNLGPTHTQMVGTADKNIASLLGKVETSITSSLSSKNAADCDNTMLHYIFCILKNKREYKREKVKGRSNRVPKVEDTGKKGNIVTAVAFPDL